MSQSDHSILLLCAANSSKEPHAASSAPKLPVFASVTGCAEDCGSGYHGRTSFTAWHCSTAKTETVTPVDTGCDTACPKTSSHFPSPQGSRSFRRHRCGCTKSDPEHRQRCSPESRPHDSHLYRHSRTRGAVVRLQDRNLTWCCQVDSWLLLHTQAF